MAEDQGYRGPFAPTSPAPKQGFAHNEESSHERGKEYRDQGSLFTYAPNGGEVEPQHHDREREGWLGYRDLAKKDPRYKHVSKQEFGHMLLAIQDLLQYIYEETREERQELYNFIHMIKG